MNNVLDKSNLRKMALEKRATFSRDLSIEIVNKILNSADFKNAQHVALYLPIKNEIDISGILSIKEKCFYLPRCNGCELEFVKYNGASFLTMGKFNILEPQGCKVNPEILDIIYIPALIANSSCYRLGYGKGYYDKFFAKNKVKAKKIIIVPKKLILDEFKHDEYDYKCDEIISA
ncbi:MAG: 5-formyltetrahydrofolate cyclo-ligase [Candidatus Gastranaerophilales bacterium]|nr:5-formyltetrahydrofolate cyclo-ligase [Candidatus Gastranaerophilales bacterium]